MVVALFFGLDSQSLFTCVRACAQARRNPVGGGTVVVHVGYCGPAGGLRSLLRVVHGGGLRQRVKVFAEVF